MALETCDLCGHHNYNASEVLSIYRSSGLRWLCYECANVADDLVRKLRRQGEKIVRSYIRKVGRRVEQKDKERVAQALQDFAQRAVSEYVADALSRAHRLSRLEEPTDG